MKTITVPKGARAVKQFLNQARDEDVLVDTEDGTVYFVRALDEFALEIEAQRRNKKLMAFLDGRAKETDWIPFAEVQKQLGLRPRKPTRTRARRSDRQAR